MTIPNSNTPTKESILEKWNHCQPNHNGHIDQENAEFKLIENRIASLLERDYFVESVQKRKSFDRWDYANQWEGVEDALSDEEKRELKLYREIFEWDERYTFYSSWNSKGYCDQVDDTHEFDEPYTLADVKRIIESRNLVESLSEPDESDYCTDVVMSSFKAEIELEDLRLRVTKTPISIKEQLSEMSEKIMVEGEKYQGIINELRSHKDDPSYHFEDIEHYFNLFIAIPIGLTDLCKQLEAQLEDKTND